MKEIIIIKMPSGSYMFVPALCEDDMQYVTMKYYDEIIKLKTNEKLKVKIDI